MNLLQMWTVADYVASKFTQKYGATTIPCRHLLDKYFKFKLQRVSMLFVVTKISIKLYLFEAQFCPEIGGFPFPTPNQGLTFVTCCCHMSKLLPQNILGN